jgi:hypothetical protein
MDLTQAVITIVGANIIMLLSSIGITISLFMHLDKKTSDVLAKISDEMKDFHGRLCAIEERNKGNHQGEIGA